MFKPEDISKLNEIKSKLEANNKDEEFIDEKALEIELKDMRKKRAERYAANWNGEQIKVVDFFEKVVIPKIKQERLRSSKIKQINPEPTVTIDKAVWAAEAKSTVKATKRLAPENNNGTIKDMKTPDVNPNGGAENSAEKEAILKSLEFNTTKWRAKLTEEFSSATGQEARNESETRLKIFETDPYRWISDAYKLNKQNLERELEEDPKESTKEKINESLIGIKEYEDNLKKADTLKLELPVKEIYYSDFKLKIGDEFLHTKNEKLVEKLNKEFKEKGENNYKVTRLFRRNQKLIAEIQTENPASKTNQITIPKIQHLIKEIKEQKNIKKEETETKENKERNVEQIMTEFVNTFKEYSEFSKKLPDLLARKKELQELIAKEKENTKKEDAETKEIPPLMTPDLQIIEVKNGKLEKELLINILKDLGISADINQEVADKLLKKDGTLGAQALKREFKLNPEQIQKVIENYNKQKKS